MKSLILTTSNMKFNCIPLILALAVVGCAKSEEGYDTEVDKKVEDVAMTIKCGNHRFVVV